MPSPDMHNLPLFSIIVPSYNNAGELDNCLQSLQTINMSDQAEIIVIDDCSPDESPKMELAAKNRGASYYRQQENKGPGIARNRGVDAAKGEILVFIDSDCVAPEDWLINITKPIREDRAVATISSYCGPVSSGWITVYQDEDYRYRMPSEECNTSFLNSCNFAIKRSTFLNCGGFPEQRISEDMVLGLLLSENGTPALFIPDACVFHDYYKSTLNYLKQRFSFAYNTVKSYRNQTRVRSKKANENTRSFNPIRTALSMLFTSLAVSCLLFTFIAVISSKDITSILIIIFFTCVVSAIAVNGRFMAFLIKRQGTMQGLSYVPLFFLIDVAYIWGVLKGLASPKSS